MAKSGLRRVIVRDRQAWLRSPSVVEIAKRGFNCLQQQSDIMEGRVTSVLSVQTKKIDPWAGSQRRGRRAREDRTFPMRNVPAVFACA